jgi:hypothetical protein
MQDFKQCFAGRGKEDGAVLKTERETSLGLLQKMSEEEYNLRWLF